MRSVRSVPTSTTMPTSGCRENISVTSRPLVHLVPLVPSVTTVTAGTAVTAGSSVSAEISVAQLSPVPLLEVLGMGSEIRAFPEEVVVEVEIEVVSLDIVQNHETRDRSRPLPESVENVLRLR